MPIEPLSQRAALLAEQVEEWAVEELDRIGQPTS
jgi:hypothetical protein